MNTKKVGFAVGFKPVPTERVEKRLRRFHKQNHQKPEAGYIEHDVDAHAFLRKNSTSVLGELRGAIDEWFGKYIQQHNKVPAQLPQKKYFVNHVEKTRRRVATEMGVPESQVRSVPEQAVEHWVETSMERGRQILQTGKPIPKDLKKLLNYRIPVHL